MARWVRAKASFVLPYFTAILTGHCGTSGLNGLTKTFFALLWPFMT